MVRSTDVINGETVRVWEESRGNKTLVKKFCVNYTVYAILNGKSGRKTYKTLEEAINVMEEWKEKIQNKYSIEKWLNYSSRTPITHVEAAGYWKAFMYRAEVYIFASGGRLISEEIV